MVKKDKVKKTTTLVMSLLLLIGLVGYFLFGETNIMPEFIGIGLSGLIVLFIITVRIPLTAFLLFIGGALISSFALWRYGMSNDISWLTDIMPEMIGYLTVALILSLLFRKKVLR